MYFHWVDWAIVAGIAVFFIVLGLVTKKYSRSTADFLSANRSAGRYLLTMAEGLAGLGAISIVAQWQSTYKVGFAASWWSGLAIPVSMIVMLTGWVIYRYRETRVFTMAQFFEIRYTRKFRVLAGTICWFSGILNFGIFPAVAANFFINYCGLPEYYHLIGVPLSTYLTLVVLLIGIALYFTLAGGQIVVIITDFFQSFFCNIVFITLLVILLIKFPLKDVFDSLMIAEEGKSMVDPFDAGKSDFDPFYFLIGILGFVFNRLSWQGSQAYHCSAKSPHEAKMAGVLSSFRSWGFMYVLFLIPLIAYMIMHHSNYTIQAEQVRQMLVPIENEQVRDQMLVPLTMTLYMPVGLMGAFGAVMFIAFVSTNDTYLHSWGTIFIQDVVLPLRKKPFSTKQHMWALRSSVIFVGVFVGVFSCFYRQTLHIYYFMAVTGAIWSGGIGAVIIGGLYTRWGSTAGAYAALISGSILAGTGMICSQLWVGWYGEKFFLTGQEVYFCAMVIATLLYTVFSLTGKRTNFNMDKMLHRGKYRIVSEHTSSEAGVSTLIHKKFSIKKALGITEDFTLGDKTIYGIAIFKTLVLFTLFVVMTVIACFWDISSEQWSNYHYYMFWIMVSTSLVIAVWLSIGGLRDAAKLFKDLRTAKRDFSDDGRVVDHDYEGDTAP